MSISISSSNKDMNLPGKFTKIIISHSLIKKIKIHLLGEN